MWYESCVEHIGANDISQLAAPDWSGPDRGEIRGEKVWGDERQQMASGDEWRR